MRRGYSATGTVPEGLTRGRGGIAYCAARY
jgi:hypothetical protein